MSTSFATSVVEETGEHCSPWPRFAVSYTYKTRMGVTLWDQTWKPYNETEKTNYPSGISQMEIIWEWLKRRLINTKSLRCVIHKCKLQAGKYSNFSQNNLQEEIRVFKQILVLSLWARFYHALGTCIIVQSCAHVAPASLHHQRTVQAISSDPVQRGKGKKAQSIPPAPQELHQHPWEPQTSCSGFLRMRLLVRCSRSQSPQPNAGSQYVRPWWW